jgi:recombination protein RecT
LLDLAYRSGEFSSIYAQEVYENDTFEYEYGLETKLVHKPVLEDRGEVIAYYAVFKLKNGGSSFVVMSKDDALRHAKKYSKAFNNSPWTTGSFDEMAKKTCIKKLLKYAPLKSDFVVDAVASDEHKMVYSEASQDVVIDMDTGEVLNAETVEGEKAE